MALLALKTDQAPTNETLEIATTNNSVLRVVLEPDQAGAAVTFATGNVGSVGGFYPADGVATDVLTDVSGAPLPAEVTLAAVSGDLLEVRGTLRFLIAADTFVSLQMAASDDNFATDDVIAWTLLDYTAQVTDQKIEPTMIGVIQVPRTGTWKIRIRIRCEPDPSGLGATWIDEPLWFVGNNWGQGPVP